VATQHPDPPSQRDTAIGQDPPSKLPRGDFVRVKPSLTRGEVIQCSVRVYSPPKHPHVSRPQLVLVAMTHEGEWDYFEEIGKEASRANLVLYEELGGAGYADRQGWKIAAKRGFVSQEVLVSAYEPKKWRCADLSATELLIGSGYGPESIEGYVQMARQSQEMAAGQSRESYPLLRWSISADDSAMFEGQEAFILRQRNVIAMGELTRASYQSHERVALLYGAAHMPKIDAYLRGPLGYTLASSRWLDAAFKEE
jgi:hypothetical protein